MNTSGGLQVRGQTHLKECHITSVMIWGSFIIELLQIKYFQFCFSTGFDAILEIEV